MPYAGPIRILAVALLLSLLPASALDAQDADRVAALVDAVEAADRAEAARLTLFELRDLGTEGDLGVLELLASSSPRIRRAALLEIHQRHVAAPQGEGCLPAADVYFAELDLSES